ncbi:MAG: zinc ABC transporter substrate-binding protein [Caldilineaceae bacterium]
MRFYSHRGLTLLVRLIFALALAACTAAPATTPEPSQRNHADGSRTTADALDAVALTAGEQLQVAATTSIIGDVVAQIGGQHISVTTIMMPGVDPHSYTPTPQDLRTLSAVDVIFINGLHLEEGLDSLLSQAGAPQFRSTNMSRYYRVRRSLQMTITGPRILTHGRAYKM